MRRVFLLFTIIGMCSLVALAGTMTFLKSDSVLKQYRHVEVMEPVKNLRLVVNMSDETIYLVGSGKVIKSYPFEIDENNAAPPSGDWIVTEKEVLSEGTGGYYMGFNVPWGKYGIHGSIHPWSIKSEKLDGCIMLGNEDAIELYKMIRYGTQIRILKSFVNVMEFDIIKSGDRGEKVYDIQRRLKKLGYYKGYPNGIYDRALKNAVHLFQKKNNMKVEDVIGYSFYCELNNYLY